MAEHLKVIVMRTMIRCMAASLVCTVQPFAAAQALVDPTRPPAALVTGESAPASANAPVLQSVLMSPRRIEAIINGQTVKVGDKVGDARVVRIKENEVVLRTGKSTQVLKLYPAIEKRMSPGVPAPKRITAGSEGKS